MARTTLTVQSTSLSGLAPTMTTVPGAGANNGVSFPNDGTTVLMVINAGTGATVPTLDAVGSLGGVALTDPTGSVANDSIPEFYGPFDRQAFGGTVGVDFSVATSVTVAAIRVPRA